MTTNGEMRGRSLTVIATVDGTRGTSAGVLSRSNVRAGEVEALVRAAEEAARSAEPADDARPLVTGEAGAGWADEPAVTTSAVFGAFAPALGAAFAAVRISAE